MERVLDSFEGAFFRPNSLRRRYKDVLLKPKLGISFMNDFNDGALLDHLEKTGDAQAFMELVTPYQGMMYGVCLRILHDPARAEELVQDCFLKLTHTRPKHLTTLVPWLHRVATTASIDSIRKGSRRTQRETEFSELQTSITENQWNDINEILDEELDSLPDPYR